ncbi:MAG: hypothetical protein FJ297_10655 [Planctomycetes bacterium]|nr:hypothetical protein [Planctomycetota bacterium]
MTMRNRIAIGLIGAVSLGLAWSYGCQRKRIEPPVPESEIDALDLDIDTGVDAKGPPTASRNPEPDSGDIPNSGASKDATPSPAKS